MRLTFLIIIIFLIIPCISNSQGILDIFKSAKESVNNTINNEVENTKNKAANRALEKAERLKKKALEKAEKARQAAIDKADQKIDNTTEKVSDKVNNIVGNKTNNSSSSEEIDNNSSNTTIEPSKQVSNSSITENKPKRRIIVLDSLLAYSSEVADTAFSNKFPFLINQFKIEKRKDTAIKKILFIHNKYLGGGNIVYKNRGLFFINELSMLRNKYEVECNTINNFYYYLGLLHAQNRGIYNGSDSIVNMNRQVYVSKFILNKCLGIGTECYPLKAAINNIKNRAKSNAYLWKESANQILIHPLFSDFEKYSNSCNDVDKPKKLFNLSE